MCLKMYEEKRNLWVELTVGHGTTRMGLEGAVFTWGPTVGLDIWHRVMFVMDLCRVPVIDIVKGYLCMAVRC